MDHESLGADVGDTHPTARYDLRATLGEGGMGEVLLCRDRRIGRDVAMKVALKSRAEQPDMRARFLREARVQGQLEHPAIVPVYDMAQDASGRSFFTMKRVRGLTLETVLGHLAAGESAMYAEYTRHKLLAAFGRVCLAIDFAHSRGVVHRDLKPANVMLGDFGEVYVLDWGVAKVEGSADDVDDEALPALEESGERRCLSPVASATEDGIVLGTPAYMAPEQQCGHPVDARTDVYALGAILFEILTLRGLFDCRSSRGSDVTRAAEWAGDVPPELAAVWRKATSAIPEQRHASARELHDEVERFLAGDRDLAARKALAAAHLAAAREIRAAASGGDETAEARSRVLAEVGRAIALDPNDGEAMRMLVELLGDVPKKAPPEAIAELARADEQTRRFSLRRAILMYTMPPLLFFFPALALMGVKSFCAVGLLFTSFLLAGAVAALSHYKNSITDRIPWVTIASSIAMATSAVLSGTYVLLPTFVVGNTICHAIAARRSHRRMIVALGILAIVIPMALESFGVIPRSYAFVDGALVIRSHAFDLREPFAPLFLLLANVGFLVFTARYVGTFRDAMARAELARLSQLWQLRQLVPERVRSATSDPPRSG